MRFPITLSLALSLGGSLSAQTLLGFQMMDFEDPSAQTNGADSTAAMDAVLLGQQPGQPPKQLIVSGAFGDDTNAPDAGKAWCAVVEDGQYQPTWTELPMPPGDVVPNANFGKWVMITQVDETNQTCEILVGAIESMAGSHGTVYCYDFPYGSPNPVPTIKQTLTRMMPTPLDHFGASGTMCGDGSRLFVGATLAQVGPVLSGSVTVFQRGGNGLWQMLTEIVDAAMPHGALFGRSIAANENGTACAIGAPRDQQPGEAVDSGSVSIWTQPQPMPVFQKLKSYVPPNTPANANTGHCVGHIVEGSQQPTLQVSFTARGANKAYVIETPTDPTQPTDVVECPVPHSTQTQATDPLFGHYIEWIPLDVDREYLAIGIPFGANGIGQIAVYEINNNNNLAVKPELEIDAVTAQPGAFVGHVLKFLAPNKLCVADPVPGFLNQAGGRIRMFALDGKLDGDPKFRHSGTKCGSLPLHLTTVGGQRPGDKFQWQVHESTPFSFGALVFGDGPGGAPLPGGCATPLGIGFLGDPFFTDAAGEARGTYTVPQVPSAVGLKAFAVSIEPGAFIFRASQVVEWIFNSY